MLFFLFLMLLLPPAVLAAGPPRVCLLLRFPRATQQQQHPIQPIYLCIKPTSKQRRTRYVLSSNVDVVCSTELFDFFFVHALTRKCPPHRVVAIPRKKKNVSWPPTNHVQFAGIDDMLYTARLQAPIKLAQSLLLCTKLVQSD